METEDTTATAVTEEQRSLTLAYLKGELAAPERDAFEEALTEFEALRDELERSRELLEALTAANDPAIVRLVNSILQSAIDRNASDIHILPERRDLSVRLRVDGSLRELFRLPKAQQAGVIDRLKTMANMQVGENQIPQDGRILSKEYDIRVTTLPTLYGERITARILNQSTVLLGLDRLNLSEPSLAALTRLTRRESGLILTSGHTGVGKTTLLYSLLLAIQADGRRGRNLMTVEDPIECQLNGVSQTQINPRSGLQFANALRAMQRCDPDAILCGEIRDRESAGLVVQIAMTGPLVLSALHTTSACGAIQRLRDNGVENFRIADSLAGLIAQRLVRRIDPAQTEEYAPTDDELQIAGLARADGPFRRGIPTDDNGGAGFKGILPLLEVVEITPLLRRLITENAPPEDLQRAAFGAGGSLRADGITRIKAGLTTVEEVNRVLSDYPFQTSVPR